MCMLMLHLDKAASRENCIYVNAPLCLPYHPLLFQECHLSQAEEERRHNDICKPGGGTQKTSCRSRLILHSTIATNSMILDTKGRDMNILRLLDLPCPTKYSLSWSFLVSWSTSSIKSYSPPWVTPFQPCKRPLEKATSKTLLWSPLLPAPGSGQGLLKNPTAATRDLQRGS